MYMPLAEQTVRALGRERELDAEAERRRRQLIEIRRWQRKADKANLRVRLALRDVR